MICKCGEVGDLKVFNSFQYYYCHKCKEEIPLELVVPEYFLIEDAWNPIPVNET